MRKYTVHYSLRVNEQNALKAVLKENVKTFTSFSEAVAFIRALKVNEKVIGEPILGV